MYTEIAIGSIILVAVIIILFLAFRKKDNFDISVDPVRHYGPYSHLTDVKCPKRVEDMAYEIDTGGLNPEDNTNVSLQDYLNKYEQANDFTNPDTARLVSKRYCDLTYTNHRRWYTDRWSGSGECEIEIKKRVEQMYPNTPKKPLIYQ